MVPSSLGIVEPQLTPPEPELARAAEIINAGSKVAILIGQGAREAADQVLELADLTGAGVAKALLGKDVLSDELPFITGSIGLLGTRPSYELMRGCDTLITIGSNFPYTQFMPDFGQARAIQIDIDPRFIGMRYPYELNLVGSSGATLKQLLPMIERKDDRSWRDSVEQHVARWWDVMSRSALVDADPINPQRVFAEASELLPDNVIVSADSGSAANWYARNIKLRPGMRGSLSGTLATMGNGVPYMVGAKFGHPDRPAVAFVGDGAMQMNGINELITISKYWQEWTDPRLVIAVLHNDDLNQVTWEMRAMEGAPQFLPSQQLPSFPYADYARSIGLEGILVDRPEDIAGAWRHALAADRPCLLEFITDPAVPPIPPHATLDQIENMISAVVRGDSDRWDVIKEGVKLKAQEFLPGSHDK
jgi:pyruvate dehydrogenase (quinone)